MKKIFLLQEIMALTERLVGIPSLSASATKLKNTIIEVLKIFTQWAVVLKYSETVANDFIQIAGFHASLLSHKNRGKTSMLAWPPRVGELYAARSTKKSLPINSQTQYNHTLYLIYHYQYCTPPAPTIPTKPLIVAQKAAIVMETVASASKTADLLLSQKDIPIILRPNLKPQAIFQLIGQCAAKQTAAHQALSHALGEI